MMKNSDGTVRGNFTKGGAQRMGKYVQLPIVASFKGEDKEWTCPYEFNREWRRRDPDGFSEESGTSVAGKDNSEQTRDIQGRKV